MLHELVLKEIGHRKQGDPNLPHVDEQQSCVHSITVEQRVNSEWKVGGTNKCL